MYWAHRKTSTGWGFGGREHERLYRKSLMVNPSLNRQRPVGYLEKPAELAFRGTRIVCHARQEMMLRRDVPRRLGDLVDA